MDADHPKRAMPATRDVPVEYLLRTVRVGVWTTVLAVVGLGVSLLLPGGAPFQASSLLPAMFAAVAVGVAMGALPWARLLRSPQGTALFHTWNLTYIVLISVGIHFTGGGASTLVLLYALTIVFAAMAFAEIKQALLFAFTMGCYLAVLSLSGWNTTPARMATTVSALGALAFMAGHLSRELRAALRSRMEGARESDRRAELLHVVADAARSVNLLDSHQVLEAVVRAANRLGFEAANLAVYDDAGFHYRVAHAIGLPAEYTEIRHPVEAGMPGLVRDRKETVVVEDYASHPVAIPVLREAGFRSTIATPVWVQGSLDAALIAGARERRRFTEEDVEAFELLAALAGRALENAHLFEDEHRAVQRLGELDRLKSDFLSSVSHELRTPLTAIQGMGLTLEQQWDELDDGIRRELLNRLNANVISLHGIISTLLDFSRLEAGYLQLHTEPVALRTFVAELVGRLGTILAGHRVTVDVPPEHMVRADPALLERVVENLVSNAVKYTPAGTPVSVSSAEAEDGTVEVAVTDRGPGIPEGDLRHLGDRFFRGGDVNTRRTRGTGLGLALVREILRLHGSDLHIESEVGRGSRFSFRLETAGGTTAAPSTGERASAP